MALTQQDKEELYQYIVSRGQSIASLPVGDATLTNKYLGPVIEYGSGGGSGRLVRLAVSLLQGRPAMLRNEGGFIQWSVKDSNAWETLVNVSELRGPAGPNPVFRKNAGNLEYKIDGADDSTYQALVALSEITGPEGDHVVLEVRGGEVMYKQSRAADTDFKKVFTLADLRGDTGPAPVLEVGTVTTVEPSEPAAAALVENGVDASGAKKYRLDLSMPKGKNGADGSGSGNVLVDPTGLLAAKQYAFRPGQDGSANGKFVEVETPEAGAYYLPGMVIDLLYVTASNTSDEIFSIWGGKAALLDFVKNFDANRVYAITEPHLGSIPVSLMIDYTDDDNYQIDLIISMMPVARAFTVVQSGVASVEATVDQPAVNASRDVEDGRYGGNMYLMYDANRSLVWNHNKSLTDTGGWGPGYAAYSHEKSVYIKHEGDGTKYLNDQGQYASVPVASTTAAGLMSKEDKVKLDGLSEGGSGSDADTVLIPADLLDLSANSTHAEIQAVLEGAGGFDALVASVKSAGQVLIRATRTVGALTLTACYPITATIAEVAGEGTQFLISFINGQQVSKIQITKNQEGNLSVLT